MTSPPRVPRRYAVEGAAVVGGYLAAAVAAVVPMPARAALLVGGAVCVAVPVFLKSRRELARDRAVRHAEQLALDYEARLAATLGRFVTPLGHLLGAVAEAGDGERPVLQGQLRQAAVAVASELCGPGWSRAIFFELTGAVMSPSAWAGRGDEPTMTFRRGADERSDAAFALLATRDYLFVRDTHGDDVPPGIDVAEDAAYQTFLSVPVATGDQAFGLLTVDAREVGALDRGALEVARALASLLAAGLAVGRGGRW